MTPSDLLTTSDPVAPLDDRAVMARVKSDDEAAFGVLYDRHAPAVLQLCTRWTVNRERAEDALFVTFLEAWRTRRRMTLDGGSARPWVLAVAARVVEGHEGLLRRHRGALERWTADRVA